MTHILIDAKNICYISYFGYPDLSSEDIKTSITYGMFTTVLNLFERFGSNKIYMFWDSDKSFRKRICPEYKANRTKDHFPEDLFVQINFLKEKMKGLGFQSYLQRGYEADDLIAEFCAKNLEKTKIVVSNDHDLYQILDYRTSIFDPRKKLLIKKDDFSKEWEIGPPLWAEVKAMAGCSSDNIKGIQGIGERTAAKKFNGKLTPRQKKLIEEGKETIKKNLPLVKLPFKGPIPIAPLKYKSPEYNLIEFESFFIKLSINSFIKNFTKWINFCKG